MAYLNAPENANPGISPAVSRKAAAMAMVSSLEFKFEDVKVHRRLGAGSFGQVYLATLHETPVALKVLMDTKAIAAQSSGPKELSNVSSSGAVASASPSALLDEASLMASLRHPNVVNFLGFCLAPPCIVTEYCTRGSVYDLISAAKADGAAGELTWRRILDMAIGAATGMLHLHTRSPPVIHRDLKSPNLLVAADWTVKVADFNLSKLIDDAVRSSRASTGGGPTNPRWLAPEMFMNQKASVASDIYAFGVVMWEMVTWQLPWGDMNPYAVSQPPLCAPAVLHAEKDKCCAWHSLRAAVCSISSCADPCEAVGWGKAGAASRR